MSFDNKDILQHIKFVNWRIGELEISFFDVTNSLDITERQIPQKNDLADWSHDKSIVLSRFYNECFQMDHLREIHKRGPSATCHSLHSAPFYFYFISNDRNISWHETSDLETQKVHSVFSKLHCEYIHIYSTYCNYCSPVQTAD